MLGTLRDERSGGHLSLAAFRLDKGKRGGEELSIQLDLDKEFKRIADGNLRKDRLLLAKLAKI